MRKRQNELRIHCLDKVRSLREHKICVGYENVYMGILANELNNGLYECMWGDLMNDLKQKIKSFVKDQGVEVVGMAGPDRLDGPPSLDPTYTMRRARSLVSMALPMNVEAIYAFLGKKSPTPHGLDQTKMNQKIFRIATSLANYINSLGYRAKAVPPNNTYRRSFDAFSTHPSFSHRFGAIATGIGAQGWSGNIMTKQYGAAIYLGTVVTDAGLESDKPMHPRYFIDNDCKSCKLCERTCVAGMFESEREEYVLINRELHPRGKRVNIDLCNASCFGLHSLSRDKKWTTWGHRWIEDWVDHPPEASSRLKMRYTLMREATLAGDSTPRYDMIRRIGSLLWPEELIDGYINQHPEHERESVRTGMLMSFAGQLGVRGLRDERILTCGQCALVCGPSIEETARRYKTLVESGLVVPGPGGEMVNVPTYEEALELRKKYLQRVPIAAMVKDNVASTLLWHRYYFGFEPKSMIQAFIYNRKLKKAVHDRIRGHAEYVN
jgi:epoxyqueuosine reductase QueG